MDLFYAPVLPAYPASLLVPTATRRPRTPPAWRPLFERRHESGVLRLQFALAGMSAHINRDLPVAVAECARVAGFLPPNGGAQHRDFLRVNLILESVMAAVKPTLLAGLLGEVDDALARADDLFAMWNVRAARDTGWVNGRVLWSLRSAPRFRDAHLFGLDKITGVASRGLLLLR